MSDTLRSEPGEAPAASAKGSAWRGQALVVEDSERDYRRLRRVIDSLDLPLDVVWARTYTEARRALTTKHFDVALIDLVLDVSTEPYVDRWEGLLVIDDIHEFGLRESIPVIVVTSFPRPELIRLAFVTHRVVDVVSKHDDGFANIVTADLEERLQSLGLRCALDAAPDGDASGLLQRIIGDAPQSLSSRLSPPEAESEVANLLRACHSDCERISLRPLQAGRGGTAVFQIERYLKGGRHATPTVAKVGQRALVDRERAGWESVREYLTGNRSTELQESRVGLSYGVLRYKLVGAGGGFRSFGDFYSGSSAAEVEDCLTGLFRETFRQLRDPVNLRKSPLDLLEVYGSYLKLKSSGVVQGYEFQFGTPLQDDKWYMHRELDRRLPNAVREFRNGNFTWRGETTLALSHGDLHGDNILVGPDGGAWVIDFGAAGLSHWARDYVLLESYVRLRLLQNGDISDLYRLERLLAAPESLSQRADFSGLLNSEVRKAGATIACIRAFAAEMSVDASPTQAWAEYSYALLATTLKYLQMHRLLDKRWRKHHLMIAAGVTLERLRELEEGL